MQFKLMCLKDRQENFLYFQRVMCIVGFQLSFLFSLFFVTGTPHDYPVFQMTARDLFYSVPGSKQPWSKIKGFFTRLIQKLRLGLSAPSDAVLSIARGHRAGPAVPVRQLPLLRGIKGEEAEELSSSEAKVTYYKSPLLHGITNTLRLSVAQGSGKRSCAIWSPSSQGEKHQERLCQREEETEQITLRENSSLEEWRDQNKQRKKYSCAICKSFVVKLWNSGTENRREMREVDFLHLFSSFQLNVYWISLPSFSNSGNRWCHI